MERAGGRFLVVAAIDDDRGSDLVTVAEYREELCSGIDPDPDRTQWNARVVPGELPEVHWLVDLQQ